MRRRNQNNTYYIGQPAPQPTVISMNVRARRSYGFLHFMFDLLMLGLTAGLWIIWIIFREIRRTNNR